MLIQLDGGFCHHAAAAATLHFPKLCPSMGLLRFASKYFFIFIIYFPGKTKKTHRWAEFLEKCNVAAAAAW